MNSKSELYLNLIRPSRTRSAEQPIKHIPLEKVTLSRSAIMDPYYRVFNIQGIMASAIHDADADAGKYYYIHIDPYDTTPSSLRLIDEVSPIRVNPSNFEPGSYYNYIVASIIGKDPETQKTVVLSQSSQPQIFITKVINIYEFGTKHHQILYRMAVQDESLFAELSKTYNNIKYRIYAAGEIMCEDEKTLRFNFYSGTYKMKSHISKRRSTYEEAYIIYMMSQFAPRYVNILFQYLGFMTENVLPLTKKELSRLRRHKVPLFLFSKYEKCSAMRQSVIQYKHANKTKTHFTVEEIQKIYKTICDKE
jgi:hypothetical protein